MLYEYVLSTGKTGSCFSLYTTPPKKLLELGGTTLKDSGLVVPTVVYVEDSDQDVGEVLSDTLMVRIHVPSIVTAGISLHVHVQNKCGN